MAMIDPYRPESDIFQAPNVWEDAIARDEHFGRASLSLTHSYSEPVLTYTKSEPNKTERAHLLVAAVGLIASGIIVLLLFFTGLAEVNGYPLSYFALGFVLLSGGGAVLVEWRSRKR